MAQDTTPAIVCYQGTGTNAPFDVPFDKGYYGEVRVLFVRRGLADYTYYPDTYVVNGRLYAWKNGNTYIYTHTANPAVGAAHTYDSSDVEQANDVTAIAGQTITVDSLVYSRAVQHDISSNLKLTWTGDTLEVGDFICIIRETQSGQPYTMPNNQKHIENALDNLERQIQEVKDATDSALKVDPSYDIEDSHKMNPIDWMETIIRSVDKSVRGLRYANGWLDYSLDDPNIADADKTWNHLLNTENIKSIREQSYIVAGVTYYRTQYKASDGTWKTLADPRKWDNMKLTDLADTNITSPVNGQFIMFDGLKWKNVYSSAVACWGQVLGNITDQTDLMNKFAEYVKKDGTSIMTGPLLMRATESFKCAVAPYWDGVGFFKLNDNDSVTLMASIEYNSGFEPATTNTYNIGASARKWKNLYLAGKAYVATINNGADISVPVTNSADTLALLSDIAFKSTDVELTTLASGQFLMYDGSKWINSTQGYANTDLSNLTSTGANIGNWSTNITNCIREIPQDIKLELNTSTHTLTLKAGSKVYVPHGDGNFDIRNITTDQTYTQTTDGQYLLFARQNTTIWGDVVSQCISGTTAPTGTGTFYNTSLNRIDWYNNSGTYYAQLYSFPFALITVSGGVITKIDQVFNGFGFIGNVIYALPGVKGLMPNGRNADGTAKRYLVNTSSVVLYKETSEKENYKLLMSNVGNWISSREDCYIDYNNELRRVTDNAVVYSYVFGEFSSNATGKITNFNTKQPFRAVDYNDYQKTVEQVNTNTTDIATLGTSKANTSLDNVSAGIDFVVESQLPNAGNNYIWYRKYKSGWVEQGCLRIQDSVAFTFPVPMNDTDYSVIATTMVGTGEVKASSVRQDLKTTTDCVVYFGSSVYYGYVEVKGKAA